MKKHDFSKQLSEATQPIIFIYGNTGDCYTEKAYPIREYVSVLLSDKYDVVEYFDASFTASCGGGDDKSDPQFRYRSRDESCCCVAELGRAYLEKRRCVIVDLSYLECGVARNKFLLQVGKLLDSIGDGKLIIIGGESDCGLLQNARSGLLTIELQLPLKQQIAEFCRRYRELCDNERLDALVPHLRGMYLRQISHMGKEIVVACKSDDTFKEFTEKLAANSDIIEPDITFDDIAGLDKVKEEINEKFILPYKNEAMAARLRYQFRNGILLFGPPGTGKTLIGQAIAKELNASFCYVKASDLMNMWFGETEQRIHKLFEWARMEAVDRMVVIFFDEIDAITSERGGNDVMDRVKSQLLMEFTSSNNDNILIMGATNRPDCINSAFMRNGRLGIQLYVSLPDEKSRRKIVEIKMHGVPGNENIDYNNIAERTNGYNGADMSAICDEAKAAALSRHIAACGAPSDIAILPCDFETAINKSYSTVDKADIELLRKWCRQKNIKFDD